MSRLICVLNQTLTTQQARTCMKRDAGEVEVNPSDLVLVPRRKVFHEVSTLSHSNRFMSFVARQHSEDSCLAGVDGASHPRRGLRGRRLAQRAWSYVLRSPRVARRNLAGVPTPVDVFTYGRSRADRPGVGPRPLRDSLWNARSARNL